MFKYEFEIPGAVHGMALSAARPGESLQIQSRGFYTSDDGPILYTFLDSFRAYVLGHGVPIPPEQIDSAFVSIGNDRKVTAIVNGDVVLSAVGKRAIAAGQPLYADDVADIASATISGYDFPTEGAIAFVFQFGWRRGFYFDFTGVLPSAPKDKKLGDIPALLGSLYTALMLRDRVRMNPLVLKKMAESGWFPFTRISTELVVSLYNHFAYGWDPKDPLQKILAEVGPKIADIVESWKAKPVFLPHILAFETAARLFKGGEFMGAANILLPKVEGVLRHIYSGTNDRPNAPELRQELLGRVRAVVEGYTALLPETFIQFLEIDYYARFNLATGELPPSRHTFMHGVGPDEDLKDPLFSLRLFLTLDQIFFFASRMADAK